MHKIVSLLMQLWKCKRLAFVCGLILVAATLGFSAGQGCPNEGPDRRALGKIGCKLQRVLSFHSTHLPKWLLAKHGDDGGVRIGFAFPPYFISQTQNDDGTWNSVRFGWRYDVNWMGYLFPTAAIKRHGQFYMPRGY